MRVRFLLLATLCLAACDTPGEMFGRPTYMGSGYTYHNDLYKAPPGPSAPGIGYPYSEGANRDVLQSWGAAVSDLIAQLEAKGLAPQPVYVETYPVHNAFTASYDDVLRDTLRVRGYVLEQSPSAPAHIRYDVNLPVKDDSPANGPEPALPPPGLDDFILTLTFFAAPNTVPLQAGGTYRLPAYGYVPGEDPAMAPTNSRPRDWR